MFVRQFSQWVLRKVVWDYNEGKELLKDYIEANKVSNKFIG